MDRGGRCIHMELGLPRDEEVRHLDHMMTQEEWRELIGTDDEFYLLDHSIPQVASSMLRHGACDRTFATNALWYAPVAELYGVLRGSRADVDRIRRCVPRGGVDPRSLVSFFRAGKCRFSLLGKSGRTTSIGHRG